MNINIEPWHEKTCLRFTTSSDSNLPAQLQQLLRGLALIIILSLTIILSKQMRRLICTFVVVVYGIRRGSYIVAYVCEESIS